MSINVENLIRQMEEAASQLGAGLPDLSEMIEGWAKAVEEYKTAVDRGDELREESDNLQDSVDKAVRAARCFQIHE